MSKNLEMNNLLDLYGALLTEKQLNIMDMYYNDDLSLGEIAEQCGISRQGVHDTVKRCEETVAEYEKKLGLYAAQKAYVEELKEFKAQALDIFNECKRISLSRPIAEKTIVLLENLDSKLEDYDTAGFVETIDGPAN
ncbi:MAG: putative DNA-binding protein [Ruminococcus sp.]|nr:putative DNA-binding protein [Ruminococcus sp.]